MIINIIILTKIFDNPQWQYIVFAAFSLIVFIYFLERNSCKPEWFVLMFLALNIYAFYMTGIRQAFAMTICILAYEKIKEMKTYAELKEYASSPKSSRPYIYKYKQNARLFLQGNKCPPFQGTNIVIFLTKSILYITKAFLWCLLLL